MKQFEMNRIRTATMLFGALFMVLSAQATVNVSGVPPGVSEEYFSGGRKGTVFNTTSRCMELPSPAISAV